MDIRDAKTQQLRHYIQQIQPDAIGLIECNVNWNILPVSHRLPEWTFGWWENLHLNAAFYDTYPGQQPMQAGGVSLWSINKGAHRVTEHGNDPRGLSRWAWMRYKGHSGVSLRYIAAYRLVLNKDGPLSVWSQQRTYFQQHNEDRCPRDMFTIDLCKEI